MDSLELFSQFTKEELSPNVCWLLATNFSVLLFIVFQLLFLLRETRNGA